jgi:hypothetical protein
MYKRLLIVAMLALSLLAGVTLSHDPPVRPPGPQLDDRRRHRLFHCICRPRTLEPSASRSTEH